MSAFTSDRSVMSLMSSCGSSSSSSSSSSESASSVAAAASGSSCSSSYGRAGLRSFGPFSPLPGFSAFGALSPSATFSPFFRSAASVAFSRSAFSALSSRGGRANFEARAASAFTRFAARTTRSRSFPAPPRAAGFFGFAASEPAELTSESESFGAALSSGPLHRAEPLLEIGAPARRDLRRDGELFRHGRALFRDEREESVLLDPDRLDGRLRDRLAQLLLGRLPGGPGGARDLADAPYGRGVGAACQPVERLLWRHGAADEVAREVRERTRRQEPGEVLLLGDGGEVRVGGEEPERVGGRPGEEDPRPRRAPRRRWRAPDVGTAWRRVRGRGGARPL